MRVHHLLLATTIASLVASALAQDRPRGGRRGGAPAETKNFTFREEKFRSEAVGQEVPFGIFLPKAYDDEANKDVKWPLVIWLHGMHETHLRFRDADAGAPVLDRVVSEGKLPPCVFVTAYGGNTTMYFNRKDQRWEDLITVDLLAHLTKNFRVSEQREQRAIMGVSMGGMGALRIAFTKPELFGAVAAHSAAVFAKDPEKLPERLKQFASQLGFDEVFGNPIQKEPWEKSNPLCIAENADPKQLSKVRIYFDAGTDDRYQFATGNELVHEALDKHKVPHVWRLIQGGGHSWGSRGFEEQTLPYSFAFVGEMFAKAAKDGGKPAADGKQSGDAKDAGGGKKAGDEKPGNGR